MDEDFSSFYPGGLPAYVENARRLLREPPMAYELKPITPVATLEFPSAQFYNAETTGDARMKNTLFVMVAGGLGERLGFKRGIKLGVAREVTTRTTHFEFVVDALMANNENFRLAIMTSDDTHAGTVSLIESYWLSRNADITRNIVLMKQTNAPCFVDDTPTLCEHVTKPHGHGDVHLLLRKSGLLTGARAFEYIVFMQDTNPASVQTIRASLGVATLTPQRPMCFVCVPRAPKTACGAIVSAAGVGVINVEYNRLPVDDSSFVLGNTNQLLFHAKSYTNAVFDTKFNIPEFINPKFGRDGKSFKSPCRLETMMQDFALSPSFVDTQREVVLLKDAHANKCLTHCLYAPNKNDFATAVEKRALGLVPGGAYASELSIYICNASAMWPHRAEFPTTVEDTPRVVISPWVASSFEEISKLGKLLTVADGCTLVVDAIPGGAITVTRGGTLVSAISSYPAIVDNDDFKYVTVAQDDTDQIASMRGFNILRTPRKSQV